MQKTLQWGLICMGQAFAHLSGAVRSHELAAVGRRVAEQEWDLVELIAPDAWADTLADPPDLALPDEPGAYGRPTAWELLGAVRDFLTEDVMPATSGHLAYQSRVAANVLSVVERELAQASPDPPGDDWPSLARSAWAGWPSPTRSACPEVMRTRQRSIRIERPRRLLLTGRQINGVRYARRRDEPRQDPRPRRPTEPGLGDAAVGRPYAAQIGSALITLVEPHVGHEADYNRWYEDDHFISGAMAFPWVFAGRRWVATRELQLLRYPDDVAARRADHRRLLPVGVLADRRPLQGAVLLGHGDEQPAQRDGRGFDEHRTHVFTNYQYFNGTTYRDGDAGPATSTRSTTPTRGSCSR